MSQLSDRKLDLQDRSDNNINEQNTINFHICRNLLENMKLDIVHFSGTDVFTEKTNTVSKKLPKNNFKRIITGLEQLRLKFVVSSVSVRGQGQQVTIYLTISTLLERKQNKCRTTTRIKASTGQSLRTGRGQIRDENPNK